MGKHNGKARTVGMKVGRTLANKHNRPSAASHMPQHRHTTDIGPSGPNMQSVLERNDLDEMLAMADLADRDFSAERTQVVVISTGVVDPKAAERDAEVRRQAQLHNMHRLRVPRRPAWTSDMTPDQLDAQERASFLEWRRGLAQLEEEEGVLLTAFEKNLEVWRQLWRVLERSDIVVQVVDARDPLLYRCEDLEAFARELHASKSSFVLLNKADLLPAWIRKRWADYFDKAGVGYAFWSAYQETQALQALKAEASELGVDWHELRAQRAEQGKLKTAPKPDDPEATDPRIRVLDGDDLLDLLEQRAREAVAAAGPEDPRLADPDRRLMVGLVGYPNVGKSSTINALFGSKKTAVAPTPGKTKHFQTLNVSATLCLCDCPGLVFPKFANSKAEMVAAGVVPIDRLTEMRAPVEVVAARSGRVQLEGLYGIRLPPPQAHEPADTPPTAAQAIRSLSLLRGWTAGSGLPDETRASRQLLKDYCGGKLLYCILPPGSNPSGWAPGVPHLDPEAAKQVSTASPAPAAAGPSSLVVQQQAAPSSSGRPAAAAAPTADGGQTDGDEEGSSGSEDGEDEDAAGPRDLTGTGLGGATLPAADAAALAGMDLADVDLLQQLQEEAAGKAASKRPEYKFKKKQARTKGNRGQVKATSYLDDGMAMVTGKKGGLVRIGGY